MISPEPTPPAPSPPTRIVTTEGSFRSATAVTLHAAPGGVLSEVVVALEVVLRALAITAPATPAATRTKAASIQVSALRLPGSLPRGTVSSLRQACARPTRTYQSDG